MAELRVADASVSRSNTAATLVIFAAVIGVAYGCDRAYRRWLKENDLLAGPRARLERLGTGYQERRAYATEVAQVIGGVLVEVARARSVPIV